MAMLRQSIRRRNWSVDDFDSMEIRLGNKLAKFDGAGIY